MNIVRPHMPFSRRRKTSGASSTAPVLIANFPGVPATVPVRLAAVLRQAGVGCEVYPEPLQVGKQMGYGSSHGHKLAVIVGPDEMKAETFNLRDLETRGEDKGLAWSVLEDSVRGALEIIEQRGASS